MPRGSAAGSTRSELDGNRRAVPDRLVRVAREDWPIVSAITFEDDGRFDGINDRSQLAQAEWALRVRLNERHMADGVTMRDPSTVYLDWDVELRRTSSWSRTSSCAVARRSGRGASSGPAAS
jgi:hypothetical protein